MAPVKALTVYKKKDGTLDISADQQSVLWTPLQTTTPTVTIPVANITNLQQTPETSAKVALKILEKLPQASDAVAHLFTFNSPSNPRGEANALKEVLSGILASLKADDVSTLKANGAATATPPTTGGAKPKPVSGVDKWFDDTLLKNDMELQHSLMRKDPALHRTYMEARQTKPDTISDTQFNSQFWSTRINMLRAHAVETSQKRGAYNVLSAVKPRQVDGELKMNISAEQVQLIFSQHPLVKRVYDENVPKLNEMDFWSRFFLSRLFKKLKGERITELDSTDPTFDRYLDANNDSLLDQRLLNAQVPHIIDLEGNEENTGGVKSGNQKDFTMRPSSTAKVPIVRTLNSLSSKIMAHVAPSDVDPSNPIGMDEETFNALALRDLQGDARENRIILNIKEQSRFFSNEKSEESTEASLYANQIPSEVLIELQADIDPSVMDTDPTGGLDLQAAIGVLEDSDSEDEEEKVPHVGSKASFREAQKQVLEGISAHRTELDGSSNTQSLSGLSQNLFDRLTLTQATTTEFLHHFWSLFLSGDPDRAGELGKMVETLDRAMDRINAVSTDADKERDDIIKRQKQHIRQVYEKSGKKLQWNANSVGGGGKVVKDMMAPTIRALHKAIKEYKKALAAEGLDAS